MLFPFLRWAASFSCGWAGCHDSALVPCLSSPHSLRLPLHNGSLCFLFLSIPNIQRFPKAVLLVPLSFDKEKELSGSGQFFALPENISVLLANEEDGHQILQWHFVMGFLLFLFREDYYKALINLQIERDFYSHRWISIWWDRETNEEENPKNDEEKKNVSQDTPQSKSKHLGARNPICKV